MYQFDKLKKVRHHLLDKISGLTPSQLNNIPNGFNNNIIWNLAHLTATQQGISYLRAGLNPVIDVAFVRSYLPGTKPEKDLNKEEIETVKSLLLSTIDWFERDYQNKIFVNYQSRPTRYGVTLNNIDDALEFLLFHEGLHTGYIWALKRTVQNPVYSHL